MLTTVSVTAPALTDVVSNAELSADAGSNSFDVTATELVLVPPATARAVTVMSADPPDGRLPSGQPTVLLITLVASANNEHEPCEKAALMKSRPAGRTCATSTPVAVFGPLF